MKHRKQHRKHWIHYKMRDQIRFKIGKEEKIFRKNGLKFRKEQNTFR